ncbi:ricin-type beta-trefoil lectin domain protein [Streptomyces sp. NPDC006624]|uniref:ricin-type beta-trefoil lectin domain protein n=1 Tax=Streptomyces sp. NPDC006624 TaxID=3154892 RepID=UPI0033AF79CB
MNDASPSTSPAPARRSGATDEQLSAELRKWTGATPALHPVGELLDRHWEAAFAYARLCADGPRAAGMLTTAAFTRIFGESLRQNGPTSAWRPHLLVTVRRIAAEWAGDHRRDMLHPDLLSPAVQGERPAARLLPPQHRRLLSGAFQRLPQSARCLLWHVEVEAEPLASPAGLLGLDEDGARVELGRARDRLREECLQLHRELAPDDVCRRYLRLLDVTYRRGGLDLDLDLRAHIEGCGHCAAAADQLDRFNHGLGPALAEAVLGWGGEAYAQGRLLAAESSAETSGDLSGETSPRSGMSAGQPGGVPVPPVPAGPESARTPADQSYEETFPDPVPLAREVFPDPVRTAPGTASPDPVALTGTIGESFTDPSDPSDPSGPPGPPGAAVPGPAARTHEDFPPPPTVAPRDRDSFSAAPGAPARTGTATPGPHTPGPPTVGPRTAARRSAQKAARRAARRRHLTVGILTVGSLVALPLVLWSVGTSDDGSPGGGGRSAEKSPDPGKSGSAKDPSRAGAGGAEKGALRGRLHNVASDLCVGLEGGKAVKGAEAELTTCSSASVQQWTYETDGLLRSGAAPGLCLDSRLGYSVRLAPCAGASQPDTRNVRYDFTLQGALVPRWDQDLALAPAATDGSGALVVKARADDSVQRWVIDPSKARLRMQAVNWDAPPRPTPTRTPAPPKKPEPAPTPSATRPTAQPTPSGPAPTAPPCHPHGSYCDEDGRYGDPGHGYPGYGYGGGYGYDGYGYGGGYGYDGYGYDGYSGHGYDGYDVYSGYGSGDRR